MTRVAPLFLTPCFMLVFLRSSLFSFEKNVFVSNRPRILFPNDVWNASSVQIPSVCRNVELSRAIFNDAHLASHTGDRPSFVGARQKSPFILVGTISPNVSSRFLLTEFVFLDRNEWFRKTFFRPSRIEMGDLTPLESICPSVVTFVAFFLWPRGKKTWNQPIRQPECQNQIQNRSDFF